MRDKHNMQNYVNNNITIINEFEKLYHNGIDINFVIEKFRSEELVKHNGFDYGRFRVFIDSCLLLLNKEKLNNYYNKKYKFKDFIDSIQNDEELERYLEFVKEEPIFAEIEGAYFYYSLEGKEINPWNQVAIIRSAMAHMQYGNFVQQESGQMLYYFLYKNQGIRKDSGIVFEPILHKFIHKFFSNYSYGIMFRNTFFSKCSLNNRKISRKFKYYYEITSKDSNEELYNGYNSNLMSELAKISRNDDMLFQFLEINKKRLNIQETPIAKVVNLSYYKKLIKKNNLTSEKEYFYGLKSILDFETELSNFLVHIGCLNELLYEYCVIRDCGKYSLSDIAEHKEQIQSRILDLKEDSDAKLAFEVGFVYLKLMNFVLRIEDDDYIPLRYQEVDISMFDYDKDSLRKYAQAKDITENQLQHYIIERMRNSLMHGNINISVSRKGEVFFVFSDIYNDRNDKIEISLSGLKVFMLQDCLFTGIPNETAILEVEKVGNTTSN